MSALVTEQEQTSELSTSPWKCLYSGAVPPTVCVYACVSSRPLIFNTCGGEIWKSGAKERHTRAKLSSHSFERVPACIFDLPKCWKAVSVWMSQNVSRVLFQEDSQGFSSPKCQQQPKPVLQCSFLCRKSSRASVILLNIYFYLYIHRADEEEYSDC